MNPSTAAEQWADGLASWAIPPEILAVAPQTPFVFTPSMFAAPEQGSTPQSQATDKAADALPVNGTVLDVGCGGGAAAFPLAPPASALIGTDRQADMVDLFLATGTERGVEVSGHVGVWPEVADQVPVADIAVSHNVLYNVPEVVPFAMAMQAHARRRVVIEITEFHPQTVRAPLWKHFWDLDRPSVPTAWMAVDAILDAGIPVVAERSQDNPRPRQQPQEAEAEAAFWTRMLCLPAERQSEVSDALIDITFPSERVMIWWDC